MIFLEYVRVLGHQTKFPSKLCSQLAIIFIHWINVCCQESALIKTATVEIKEGKITP
jgi:hypothetical protein